MSMNGAAAISVMPGLVPGIHVLSGEK